MCDQEVIDSELWLLAAVRRSIREHGMEPISRHLDEHLDELGVPLFTAEPGGCRDVMPDLDNERAPTRCLRRYWCGSHRDSIKYRKVPQKHQN